MKKFFNLKTVIVLAILILIAVLIYFVYSKPTTRLDHLFGYKTVDISNPETMDNKWKIYKSEDNTKEITLIKENERYKINKQDYLTLKEGCPIYHVAGQDVKNDLDNIAKIYVFNKGDFRRFAFVGNDGSLYFGDLDDLSNNAFYELEKIEGDYFFESLELVSLDKYSGDSCDILGILNDGRIISITNKQEFNYAKIIPFYDDSHILTKKAFINENRDVRIGDKSLDHKYKMSFAKNDEELFCYFVTTDDYLYDIRNEHIVNINKINKVFVKNKNGQNDYVVEFADGMRYELN